MAWNTTWLGLESNPEVLTKYIHRLGVNPLWSLSDVVSLDSENLEYILQPVKAVILLRPFTEGFEAQRKQLDAEMLANPPPVPNNIYHMRQYIHNGCGTIALIHGIANSDIELEEGSILKNFLDTAKNLTPEERGKLLENDTSIASVHREFAVEGQTEASGDHDRHHYTVLVNHENELYELDGAQSFPLNHGPTTDETFLQDAAKLCKEAIDREPDDVHFCVIVLAPALD